MSRKSICRVKKYEKRVRDKKKQPTKLTENPRDEKGCSHEWRKFSMLLVSSFIT